MSKKANEVSKEIRSQVHEPAEREISAFVQDLVVALADVCARLGRISREVHVCRSELQNIGGCESECDCEFCDCDWWLYYFYLVIRIYAEHFDTCANVLSLLEKLNQKQDSENCPVCQHRSKWNSKFGNCWYCQESFIGTKGLDKIRRHMKNKNIT